MASQLLENVLLRLEDTLQLIQTGLQFASIAGADSWISLRDRRRLPLIIP